MIVSIEPLWNWNMLICTTYSKHIGINRTFMELKQTCARCIPQPLAGINRTFMELKQVRQGRSLRRCAVSIEPLWNWNVVSSTATRWASVYQSNLYGIETCNEVSAVTLNIVSIEPLWNWNCVVKGDGQPFCVVSIEPLWNWNWDGQAQPLTLCMYQSNLYGIET